jgi:hypothetical protein
MKTPPSNRPILVTAWTTILVLSLFKIVLQEIFHYPVSENLQYGIMAAVVIAGFALTFLWPSIRPLRSFYGLFIVMAAAQWLVYTCLDRLPIYQRWLHSSSFSISLLSEQSLNLIVALIIIAYLYIVKKKRQAFFLAVGDTAAPVEPIRWLGVKSGTRWNRFGAILAICLSLGTLAFLVIAAPPPLDSALRLLPFLPAVLLAAAVNAFYEEMTYKASFLSVLEDRVGGRQSLFLMAAYFGIGHYYGIPYGIIGVLMATFLGWLLGKSMLETRGFFWAWFIHFLQDVLIFSFLAIGSVTPGGG